MDFKQSILILITIYSPPGGSRNPIVTSDPAPSIPTTAAPVPTNARDGSNRYCGQWYMVQAGDFCGSVSLANGISLADFYFLNPNINANCTDLLLGIAYCVQPVGSISTYPGYPTTTQWLTLPPQTTRTFTTPTQSILPSYTGTLSETSQLPTASGTIPGCFVYRNSQDWDISDPTLNATVINSCEYIAYAYDAEVSEIVTWNPSLRAENCTLQTGFSYCVQKSNTGSNRECLFACNILIFHPVFNAYPSKYR